MSQKALAHLEKNKARYLEKLIELVRIPSVSFPGYDFDEVQNSAEATLKLLEECGFENAEIIHYKDSLPYVYADWMKAPGKPTVLLYAHHDVQPPMRREKWRSEPFEPTEIDGRLFARGAADDKAGILAHVASMDSWMNGEGACPLNLKVIIEGEEEVGSPNLESFVSDHKTKLMADAMIVTDLVNFDTGLPSLTTSLRGMTAFEVTIKALKAPLHSGMWSGPLPDPVMGLSKALAKLVDDKGILDIPELQADVVRPTDTEIADLKELPYEEKVFREQSGILEGVQLIGEGHSVYEQIYRQPTLTVTSIEAAPGGIAGNVIMDEVKARLSLRLAAGMDPDKSIEILKVYLNKHLPWGLHAEYGEAEGGGAWITDTSHAAFSAAREALSEGYGQDAVFIGCGGSIPFVSSLTQALDNIPALLVGVEDPYTLAHSENESLHIEDFYKSIRSNILMWEKLAKVL